MAKTKKQRKNKKGEGSFRRRSNGTFEYRIVYTDEYNEKKENHSMVKVTIFANKKMKSFFMI